MTAADYAALEARVAELEQQMRHILPGKIDAISYGLSLMHEDLRGFRSETRAALDDQRAQLVSMNDRLSRQGEALNSIGQRLDDHGQMVAEILRRVPGRPSNGPAGGQDDH